MMNDNISPCPTAPTLSLEASSSYPRQGPVRTFFVYIEDHGRLGDQVEKQKVLVAKLKLTGDAKHYLEWNDKLRNATTWEEWSTELKKSYEQPPPTLEATHPQETHRQEVDEPVTDHNEQQQVVATPTSWKTGKQDDESDDQIAHTQASIPSYRGMIAPTRVNNQSFRNNRTFHGRPPIVCYQCGKFGHIRRNCRGRPRQYRNPPHGAHAHSLADWEQAAEHPSSTVKGPTQNRLLNSSKPSGSSRNTFSKKSRMLCFRCGEQEHVMVQHQTSSCCTRNYDSNESKQEAGHPLFTSPNQPLKSSRTELLEKVEVRGRPEPKHN